MSDLVGVWLLAAEPLRYAPPSSGEGRPIVVQDPETGKWSNAIKFDAPVAYRLKITKIQGEVCVFDSQVKRTEESRWEPRSNGVRVPLDHMLDEIEMGNLVRE